MSDLVCCRQLSFSASFGKHETTYWHKLLRRQRASICCLLRCRADRGADYASRKGSHDCSHRLKLTVFHDALDVGHVVDILERVA